MESDKKLLFKHVIEYFAYAAIAIQAVLAAFWLFKNIGVFQSDYTARTYILAAESLKVDDSMGILYALIVRIFGHGIVLQIFQILMGSVAVFFFSLTAFEKKPAIVFALLIVLNPLILQAETAVSPNALAVACLLTAIASVLRMSFSGLWILAFFAAAVCAGFLSPDYAYLVFIVSFVFFLVRFIKNRKIEVLIIPALIIPIILNTAITDEYEYGRVQRTPYFLVMQRVVWPHLADYSYNISFYAEDSGRLENGVDYDAMASMAKEADKIPDNLAMVFGYEYEHLVGHERAQEAYRDLTKLSLAKGPGFWAYEAIRDEILYFFSPASATVAFIKQKTDTSVPCGLEFLFDKAPKASKIYFLFSSTVMFLFTLLYIVKCIGERAIGKKEPGMKLAFSLLGIIVLFSLYATFVCLREFDYRNVLFLVVAWPAGAVALSERRKAV